MIVAIANLYGIDALWGINYFKFLSPVWMYLALGLSALILMPSVEKKLSTYLANFGASFESSRKSKVFAFVGLFTVLPVTLYLFSPGTAFLGDGALRMTEINNGVFVLKTEFLDFLIHAILFDLLADSMGLQIHNIYHAVSAVCGPVFVIGVYRLARYLNPKGYFRFVIVLLSGGLTVLFFGYIESYSIIAATLPYLYLSGLKTVNGESHIWIFVALFIVSVLVHSVTLILFFPVLALALYTGVGDLKLRRFSHIFFAVFALGIISVYLLGAFAFPELKRFLLPFSPAPGNTQELLSIRRLVEMFNWLMFGCAPALFLFAAMLRSGYKATGKSLRRCIYALWVIVPALVFMIFFAPQLGAPRDWDLFCLPAFLLIPSALTLYRERCKEIIPSGVISVSTLAMALSLSFVAVNDSVVLSTNRFAEILEVSKFKNQYMEYALLYNETESFPEVRHRAFEFAELVWAQPPYTLKDSLWIMNELGSLYLKRGDQPNARKFAKLLIDTDKSDPRSYMLLKDYYLRYGTRADLISVANAMSEHLEDNAINLMNAGILFSELNLLKEGEALITQAFERDSLNPIIIRNYAIINLHTANYTRIINLLNRITGDDAKDFSVQFNLAFSYHETGQDSLAILSLRKALAVARISDQFQMVADLQKRIISQK
ncbi:MAG: hypothetical protein IIB00_08065 [candidate division Zixibacteria bacterium]|nr:hypothetical protein [candidate division Zixibacteria bacterium]